MKKERVDVLLVKQGLFSTREQAKRAVMAGEILGENEERLDKPGMKISVDTELHFKGTKMPYVSRGGLKLEKALKVFKVDAKNKTMLDIGSSTGGFTDVALQKGAKLSYALDVGTNQLDWKLRNDPRVKSIENRHINDLTKDEIDGSIIDYIVMDVSFISIKKILPDLLTFFNPETKLMALIKPQFEANKEDIAKGGIVKDEKVHKEIIKDIVEFAKEGEVIKASLRSKSEGNLTQASPLSDMTIDTAQDVTVSIDVKETASGTVEMTGTVTNGSNSQSIGTITCSTELASSKDLVWTIYYGTGTEGDGTATILTMKDLTITPLA